MVVKGEVVFIFDFVDVLCFMFFLDFDIDFQVLFQIIGEFVVVFVFGRRCIYGKLELGMVLGIEVSVQLLVFVGVDFYIQINIGFVLGVEGFVEGVSVECLIMVRVMFDQQGEVDILVKFYEQAIYCGYGIVG